jgi:malonyl-CoA/methylmalonyl-CoA synthetase
MTAWDRTHLFPSHEGFNVLPNSPFFTRLLRHAHRERIAVRDRNDQDIRKSYGDVLSDALALRLVVEQALRDGTRAKLKRGEEVYVGILAAGGYEFTVAMIAVLAMGAAAVPMSKHDRILHILVRSRHSTFLTSRSRSKSSRGSSILCY